ncbi:MAG: hypothetical protein WDW36_007623 [Sanguina aurantia]
MPANSPNISHLNTAGTETAAAGTCSVRTMLSQNTTDITSLRAFNTLKERFPSWDAVYAAPNGEAAGPRSAEVEDAIRVGGLAEVKVQRIKAMLGVVHGEQGSHSLEHLHQCSTEDVKRQLTRFKGVGPKTVACVLMFCLKRAEFPVDTHVWEISKRLGWVHQKISREAAYTHLNQAIPDALKFDLHVLLVTHGKVCPTCKKGGGGGGKPAGAPCPLAAIIRQGRATHPAASPVEEAEQKRTIPTPLSDAIDAVTGPGAATGEGQSEKPVAAKSRAGSSGGDGGGDDGVRSVKRQRKAGQGEAVAAAAVAAVAEAAGDGVGVKAEPVEGELLPLGQVKEEQMDELCAVKVEGKLEVGEGGEALLDIKTEVKGEVLAEAESETKGLRAAAATAGPRRSCRSGKGL